MSVKLVVLDVDGTLLDPGGLVSERVRSAVQAAHDRGYLVTLASGRRLWAVRPIVDALGIRVPVILYNGAMVYDLARNEALLSVHLPREHLGPAIDLIWEAGFQPVVYESPTGGERVCTGPSGRDGAATRHYFDRPTVQPVRLGRHRLPDVHQPLLLATMGEEAEMRALQQSAIDRSIFCQTLVERQSFVPGSRWWQLDITAPSVSKGEALRRLCALTGISIRETLAVGDGINDLDLIEAAGIGVAMGNAVSAVREAAAAIVADNASHGAAEALERFVLSPPSEASVTTCLPAQRI